MPRSRVRWVSKIAAQKLKCLPTPVNTGMSKSIDSDICRTKWEFACFMFRKVNQTNNKEAYLVWVLNCIEQRNPVKWRLFTAAMVSYIDKICALVHCPYRNRIVSKWPVGIRAHLVMLNCNSLFTKTLGWTKKTFLETAASSIWSFHSKVVRVYCGAHKYPLNKY